MRPVLLLLCWLRSRDVLTQLKKLCTHGQATNFTGILTFTCATRFFYSFARDGGFPFSKKLAYVEPRTGIPVNCVLLMLVSVIALSTAILTENWFAKINAVCSTISNGFLFTYGVPPILRLLNPGSFAPHENFNLKRFSKPCAVIGAGYAFFSVATIALPSFMPATEETLNYAPVALGACQVPACVVPARCLQLLQPTAAAYAVAAASRQQQVMLPQAHHPSLTAACAHTGAVILFSIVTWPFAGPIFNTFKGPALAHLEEETVWKGNLAYGAAPPPVGPGPGMEDTVHGAAS